MGDNQFTKWVAAWGCATSISDQKECRYSKDMTLRYPLFNPFDGSAVRLHFSNLTGSEPVTISYVTIANKKPGKQIRKKIITASLKQVTFNKQDSITILPGQEIVSDEIEYPVVAGQSITVSIYLKDCTQMNAGVLTSGPLSGGFYSYGNYVDAETLPVENTRNTKWYYFLKTMDVFTREENHAFVCFGDSITAQSWPDDLALRAFEAGKRDVSIIRRAVSGTRILGQYDCITYAAYGLKGETRFPVEVLNTSGASAVLIQHGINDIIHPVGYETNIFRPWQQMPTVGELIHGMEKFYLIPAKQAGLKVYGGTLVPFYGWRTYEPFRQEMKEQLNAWILSGDLPRDYFEEKAIATNRDEAVVRATTVMTDQKSDIWFDDTVDFNAAICNPDCPEAFGEGMDSGDHLHPSDKAYERMAEVIPLSWL